MSQRIPILQDDLTFEDRQGRIWEDMERDMERRRKEWEDEIERMRGDFFHMKPDISSNGNKLDAMQNRLTHTENFDDAKTVIEKDQNGRPVYRARFNVKDYKPDEVNVKMDMNKIMVSARHEEKDGTKSVSREFNREVTIPKEVDPMSLQCTISTDGILTVEAPLPVPGYQPIAPDPPATRRIIPTGTSSLESSASRGTPPPPMASAAGPPSTHTSTFTTFVSPKSSAGASFTAAPPSGGAEHVINQQRSFSPQSSFSTSTTSSKFDTRSGSGSPASMEKDKKYRVEVDIEDFKPEELTVKTVDKKLVISARREERVGTRTSSRELNREFHLPDTVDPQSVKAFFSDSGKLFLEAPYLKPISVGHYSDGREGSPHFGAR